MDKRVCKFFYSIRNSISDQLDNKKKYKLINDQPIKEYCAGNSCDDDLEKINAGCLFLFDALFKDNSVFKYHNNINMVKYIFIWLSYMLNLKEQVGDVNNLQYFYNMYMKSGDKYTNPITDVTEYKSYKDLVDKTKMMDMDIKYISKFYDAFNALCMMYIEFDDESSNCKQCLKYANAFIEKYKKLTKDSNITDNSSYNQILSNLSTNYNNFKKKCNDLPSISTIDTTDNSVYTSGLTSEVTSSSSIANKLLLILSIFGAIAIFLGISYKYSLFGFRKRFKKQQIREKIKNIKKKMNR
ncbi:hypothetical protein YYC_04814 [Plasmodium yoelii 17X]|uniref:PIR protein n=4 Tax=Plasmodium yoelii TaxID=5861 RepID=A0AAF0AYZ1_PLAYO|nr:uncharacterized protein PY17X_0601500 [Plasmodium yoelii]EAA17863.1 putative yir3 protein [Plasmodium yoelii yoelii]ETB57306.1 hypothetical protein YYC_04814 [Plasmodium yoelii 17X]WBY55872.1 PIR protein [Plasmodium yoelii yoelii]CDU16867.1 YIR protein [Plasmodium yoelii]VTZ75110.1 PIR protein [Plasmodium yoelii]|eukprot:XP_726298.1 uncharacterized protein PY17X_0601500 [Plasmodium yoelii]